MICALDTTLDDPDPHLNHMKPLPHATRHAITVAYLAPVGVASPRPPAESLAAHADCNIRQETVIIHQHNTAEYCCLPPE